MKICPNCQQQNCDQSQVCPRCGFLFYQYQPTVYVSPIQPTHEEKNNLAKKVLVFLGVFLVVFIVLYFASRIITQAMMRDATDMTKQLT